MAHSIAVRSLLLFAVSGLATIRELVAISTRFSVPMLGPRPRALIHSLRCRTVLVYCWED